MGKTTRREWIKPAMLIFGSQAAYANKDGKPSKPKLQGAACGESVIRYGATCGIRTGNACKLRDGHQCKARIGPKCTQPRIGTPCKSK